MKLRQRIVLMAGVLGLGAFTSVDKADAQIWANYDVTVENIFYNPLAGGTLIPDNAFVDFVGNVDPDDGVARGIRVGFPFEYNGQMYGLDPLIPTQDRAVVNVGVNGWITVGPRQVPVVTNDNNYLFLSNEPNNTVAPYWGDHYYRTLEPGYIPSRISYSTSFRPDPNPNSPPGSQLGTFTVEWRDLNINNKSNPNSIASFQVKIIQNDMANDDSVPDHRARIEFHYGPIGNLGQVTTDGASVGIEDSIGFSHMNGLFQSSFAGEDSTRLNTTKRTDCWPPATCLPGRAIVFLPEGRANFDDWGDGDVNLTQIYSTNPVERNHQNRFVTLADADLLLRSRAQAYPPLDSVEGREAFHGDANHTGQYTNPNHPGIFFYRVTSYDAAYILLYLAAKLPVLPWPEPLPVPAYKGAAGNTAISAIIADNAQVRIKGEMLQVPLVIRGNVNGALGIEMNVRSLNESVLRLEGTTAVDGGSLMMANPAEGMVVFAAAGNFTDGQIIGYLNFRIVQDGEAEIAMTNIMINDEMYADNSTKVATGVASAPRIVDGYSIEQNRPNPFVIGADQKTTIGFTLGSQESVTLRVYDMLGNVVRTIINGETVPGGKNTREWDGRDESGNLVANGMYYYQLSTASYIETVKMQVIR
jgi:hypothetical protein